MTSEYSVAAFVAEFLHRTGIPRVYGIIGTSLLDFMDAMYHYRDRVDFVTTRHEQVAVSAADGEARVTGRPSAAALHAGPGLLNATIALGVAFKDRVPLIAIVGGVRRRLRGTDAWLEVDLESLTKPVSKAYYTIRSPSDAPEVLVDALRDSMTPPRGPVVVEVPEDVWRETVRVPGSFWKELKLDAHVGPGEAEEFARHVAGLAESATKPLILACGELAWDPGFRQEDLIRLAERLGAFIVTSGNGRGACPEDHPRCLGRVGFGGGSLAADAAMESSDLLIVLGNEFDDITTYSYNLLPEGDIVVASLDLAAELRPRYYDLYKASPAAALKALLSALEGRTAERDEWSREVEEYKAKWGSVLEEALKREYKGRANPARFFKELDSMLPRRRVITGGQGTHILYTYAFTRIYEPRTFLAATNLGAMSYAFPAALGAKLAKPGEPVVSVVGDGDFMMTVQDLETAVREGIPVKVVIVNDNSYKVLYLKQILQYGGRVYETLLGNPDFSKLAEAFGVGYIRVDSDSEAANAAAAAANPGGSPLIVELPVEPDELPPVNLEYTLKMSR